MAVKRGPLHPGIKMDCRNAIVGSRVSNNKMVKFTISKLRMNCMRRVQIKLIRNADQTAQDQTKLEEPQQAWGPNASDLAKTLARLN
jgi:hypothetical protein